MVRAALLFPILSHQCGTSAHSRSLGQAQAVTTLALAHSRTHLVAALEEIGSIDSGKHIIAIAFVSFDPIYYALPTPGSCVSFRLPQKSRASAPHGTVLMRLTPQSRTVALVPRIEMQSVIYTLLLCLDLHWLQD